MVNEQKKQLVEDLVKAIRENPIVGVVNLESLPAQQLQKMRAMLLSKGVHIRMARKKLLQLALTGSKKENIDQLKDKIKGMPALLFSKDNPFTLYAIIQKNKSEAPAKAGQIVPKDVVVKAGATNFAPGPIISELAAVGIKTKVDGGKLTIISDTTVAKDGDEISQALADMLKRLDIKPMEIGLDLVAVWEEGSVFDAKQLHIDEAEYEQNIISAAQWAMNLAMESAYLTVETTELLLQKAFNEAKALSIDQDIITDLTAKDILAKVERQALALKDVAGIEVGTAKPTPTVEEKKEEPVVAEEPKVEETPKEEPPKEEPKTPKEEEKPEPVEGEEEPAKETLVLVEESIPEEKKEEPAQVPKEEPKSSKEEEKKEEQTSTKNSKEEQEETTVKEERQPETSSDSAHKELQPEPVQEPEAPLRTQELKDGSVPSAESLIQAMKEKFGGEGKKIKKEKETAESIIEQTKPKMDEVPSATELLKQKEEMEGKENKDDKSQQGDLSSNQAQDLLKKLQKEGTLRDKD